jgi:hypothetical protein
MLKKPVFPILLLVVIIFINLLRFLYLEQAPYGLIFDEETSGVTLQCLVEKGIAPLNDQPYPLFGDVGIGNPKPPTYMYPGILWVKLFGFSPYALRAFTVFFFNLAIIGLFAIGWQLRGWQCGLWIAAAASISPWTWTISRVGQEPSFLLAYLIWGIFLTLRARKHWEFILAGLLFAAAAYTYPPARMITPSCILLLSLYGMKYLDWKKYWGALIAASFSIAIIPMIYSVMSDPSQTVRWQYVSITKPEYLALVGKTGSLFDIMSIAWDNLLRHTTPMYLFFRGLPDWGVGTWHQGIMSWIDVTALVLGIFWIIHVFPFKKDKVSSKTLAWGGFLAISLFVGVLPCAFTIMEYAGVGNNMRSISAWPFAMIAVGMIMHKVTEKWTWSWIPSILAVIIFASVFLNQYFTIYPQQGALFFRAPSLEMARNARSNTDWLNFLYAHHKDGFASRYFLMRYHGDSCIQARNIYNNLKPNFEKVAEQNKKARP